MITIPRDVLKYRLSVLLPFTSGTVFPILESVKIDVDGNDMVLYATDTETAIRTVMRGYDGEGDKFSACVPAKMLLDIVKNAEANIEIGTSGSMITIVSGSARYEIPYKYSTDDFPPFDISEDTEFVKSTHPSKIFENVAFCAAKKDDFRELDTVYINEGDAVATDGFRMAIAPVSFPSKARVRVSHLKKIAGALGGTDVEVAVMDGRVMFRNDTTLASSQLVTRNFADYKSIINKVKQENTIVVKFRRDEIVSALKRVMVSGEFVLLHTKSEKDEMVLTARGDYGIGTETVLCKSDQSISVKLNAKYFWEAINALNDTLEMRFCAPDKAVLLLDDTGINVLIMPLDPEVHDA